MFIGTILVAMGFGAIGIGMSPNGVSEPYPHCRQTHASEEGSWTEEMSGTVLKLSLVRPCIGQPAYVMALVQTEAGGVLDLYLGPADFLSAHEFQIKVGDDFSATVARKQGTYSAVSVEIGSQSLLLRDDDGRPRWMMPMLTD